MNVSQKLVLVALNFAQSNYTEEVLGYCADLVKLSEEETYPSVRFYNGFENDRFIKSFNADHQASLFAEFIKAFTTRGQDASKIMSVSIELIDKGCFDISFLNNKGGNIWMHRYSNPKYVIPLTD